MAETLNSWLPKDVKPALIGRPEEELQAYKALKMALIESPVLIVWFENRAFLLNTDSSAYRIGVKLLLQFHDESTTN